MLRALLLAPLLLLVLPATAVADEILVALDGDIVAGKTLTVPGRPAVNDWGEIAFQAGYRVGTASGTGVFLRSATGTYAFIAGTGTTLGSTRLLTGESPDLNDAGELVFQARLSGGSTAIVYWDLSTKKGKILAKRGDTIGGTTLGNVLAPTIDDDGIVAFDDRKSIYQIDTSDGTAKVVVAYKDTLSKVQIVQVRNADLDDEGNLLFTGFGAGSSGKGELALFSTTARVVGPGSKIDTYTLSSADWAGIADDVGPYFVGTYTGTTTTEAGIFSLDEALVVPADELAGETIVRPLSVRPNGYGDYVFDAVVVGGRAIILVEGESNEPPVADAGKDVTREATSPDGAKVQLDGTGSDDPDDDVLTYAWTAPSGSGVTFDDATSAKPTATFPLGETVVTLKVDDGQGETDTDAVAVTVVDTTAPEAQLKLGRERIWPPNKRMVKVPIYVTASDVATEPGALEITCLVWSNEPDTRPKPKWAKGKKWFWKWWCKRHAGDVDGQDGYTQPVEVTLTYSAKKGVWRGVVRLRAERHHFFEPRTYTVQVDVEDASENETTATKTIAVEHVRRKRSCRR